MNPWSTVKETAFFLRQWWQHPRLMGAIAPSSGPLSKAMARLAKAEENGGYVVELGGGTGRLTRALLEAGIPPQRLITIEINDTLATYLGKKFPAISVIRGNACFVSEVLPSHILGNVRVVVSGLPMLNFPAVTREKIMSSAFQALHPQGRFLQFTYNPLAIAAWCPRYLKKRRAGFVMLNIPPAVIWEYSHETSHEFSRGAFHGPIHENSHDVPYQPHEDADTFAPSCSPSQSVSCGADDNSAHALQVWAS